MPSLDPAVRQAAERIFTYLAETDPPPEKAADAVIGFGVFDRALPRYCADLFARGLAGRIIFTGGFGAGTGDLGGPEADMWRAEVRKTHPDIPDDLILLENRSTNTSENIAFTAALLSREHPTLAFGTGIKTAIVVASPSRLRRVKLTLREQQAALEIWRMLPAVDFAEQQTLYERQGVAYLPHLLGEIDRIATYPARGWIASDPLPAAILSAAELLRPRATPS